MNTLVLQNRTMLPRLLLTNAVASAKAPDTKILNFLDTGATARLVAAYAFKEDTLRVAVPELLKVAHRYHCAKRPPSYFKVAFGDYERWSEVEASFLHGLWWLRAARWLQFTFGRHGELPEEIHYSVASIVTVHVTLHATLGLLKS